MANFIVNSPGQVNGAGARDALFLKLFSGEVLSAYGRNAQMDKHVRKKTITGGNSYQFPAIGYASTAIHTPGTQLTGSSIPHAEVVISLEGRITSHVTMDSAELAQVPYDARMEYSRAIGEGLAYSMDRHLAANMLNSTRQGPIVTGTQGGGSITQATARTDGAVLALAIQQAQAALKGKDVPVNADVHCALKPAEYALLGREPTYVLNRDIGGQPEFASQHITLVGGVKVFESNSLPWGEDLSSSTILHPSARVNATNTAALVFTRDTAAAVILQGLAIESEYNVDKLATILVGHFYAGFGPLRSSNGIEIKVA